MDTFRTLVGIVLVTIIDIIDSSEILQILFIVAIFAFPFMISVAIRTICRLIDIAINIGWHNYWSGDSNIVECNGCGVRFTYKRFRELGYSCSYCGSDLIHDTHQSAHKYIP